MVTLEAIRDEDKFLSMREEWNRLLEQSGIDSPYLTHEWLSSWWKAYKKNHKLNIVVFKESNSIIGFIPLVISKEKFSRLPVTTLKFFADHWGTMDFILSGNRQECLKKFLEWFFTVKPADLMILSRLPQKSENTQIFRQLLEVKKPRYESYELKNALINIEGSWEDYLKKRSKNFAEELKYKQRKIAKAGKVSYERTSALEDADSIIHRLSGISNGSWKQKENIGIAGTQEGREFYRNLIENWGSTGNLDLSLLSIDDLPIAFAMRIRNNGKLYALETSYSQKFCGYSPGLLVQEYLLQDLFGERKINTFELGESDNHKARWASCYLKEQKFIIYNNAILPRILSYLRNNLFKIKQ